LVVNFRRSGRGAPRGHPTGPRRAFGPGSGCRPGRDARPAAGRAVVL